MVINISEEHQMKFAVRSVAPPCFSSSLPHTTMPHFYPVSTIPCLYSLSLSALLPQLNSVSTLLFLNSTLSLLSLSPTVSTPLCLNPALSQLYPVSTMFKFYSLSLSPTASTLLCLNSALSQPLSHYPSIPNCKIRTNNRNVIITPSWEQATYIYMHKRLTFSDAFTVYHQEELKQYVK